jgi:diguanylate cyclase (GGDEF)-like protein
MHSRPTADASPGRGEVADYLRPRDEGGSEAHRDALTGLPNRVAWNDVIERAEAARAGSPMTASVIVLDIDRLKLANETRGDAFGDELLRTVAALVVGVLRDDDLVARIGDDEFAVLLPSVDETVCGKVVNRLRDAFARSESLDGFPITIALGWAVAHDTETLTRAERWADARMFLEKTDPAREELAAAPSPAVDPSNVVELRP